MLELIVGFTFVVGAFPVLVLERTFVGTGSTDLGFLLRLPLLALLGVGVSQLLQTAGFAFVVWMEQAVGVLVLLVAIELLLRSLATVFMPPPAPKDLHSIARSMLARVIRPAWPSLRGAATPRCSNSSASTCNEAGRSASPLGRLPRSALGLLFSLGASPA